MKVSQEGSEEIRQDILMENYREEQQEYLFRTDIDALIEHLYLTEESSIKEFREALSTTQSYGWDIDANDLMSYI